MSGGDGYEFHFVANTQAAAIALLADLREAGLTIDGRSPEQVVPPLWFVVAKHDSSWTGEPQQEAAMKQIAARHGCDYRGWR